MPDARDPDLFTSFDPGVPMSPLPAAEVRRLGDRRRRRARALGVAAAVVAVGVVSAPVAVLSQQGDRDRPGPAGPTPTTGAPATPVVPTTADLPTTAQMPRFPDDLNAGALGRWSRTTSDRAAGVTCSAVPGSLPQVAATFTAVPPGASGGDVPFATATVDVVQYADPASAAAAYAAARDQVTSCPDPRGLRPDKVFRDSGLHPEQTGSVESAWAAWSYPNYDACTGGCDAAIFDRMGVALDDDRVAWFSLRYDGGPVERTGADDVMEGLRDLVVQEMGR